MASSAHALATPAAVEAAGQENFDEGQKAVRDGRSKATISTVLVIAGGAAIAAGAVIYLTAPRARERTTALRLVPVIDDTSAGIGLIGAF